jgi:hypothetical protein
MLQSALVPIALGTVGGLIVGGVPAIVIAVLSGLTLMPSDVSRFYQELHQSFLNLNDTIAKVKDTSCWTAADLQEWRNFRDSWAKFYGTGPSTTWLLLSSDFTRAQKFAQDLVAWRSKVIAQCGGKPAADSNWGWWVLLAAGAAGAAYIYWKRPRLRVSVEHGAT